jgi:murein DD-endopeptidase MepM/ murein hydrolase activator NlpD
MKTSRGTYAVLILLFMATLLLSRPLKAHEVRFLPLHGQNTAGRALLDSTKPQFFSLSAYRSPSGASATPLKFLGDIPGAAKMKTAALSTPSLSTSVLMDQIEKNVDAGDYPPQETKSTLDGEGILRSAVWPLPADATETISSGYGFRKHPITGLRSFHDGIDIVAKRGTEVYATDAGTVIDAGRQMGLGKFVKISHASGYTSVYGHLAEITVEKDALVGRGDVVGKLGSTGLSTGPHLHYALKKDDKSVNPMTLLADAYPVKTVEVAQKAD